MKHLFLAILVLVLFSNLAAQKRLTDREADGLKGSVKSVVYEVRPPEPDKSDAKQEPSNWGESYYDKDGNLTLTSFPAFNYQHTVRIIDGARTYKFSEIVKKPKYEGFYSYPVSPEKPIEEPEKLTPPDERYDTKEVYEYDEAGRIKTMRSIQNNGRLLSISTYLYDAKGRKIQIIEVTRKGKGQTDFKYDEQGNETERHYKSSWEIKGTVSETKTVYSDYKFDAQGNWIARREVIDYFESATKTFTSDVIEIRTILYY